MAGQLGAGCGPRAGAMPGKHQQGQLWSGLEQWLPLGTLGWGSPAQHRVQPSSPALSLAWASAGRSQLAQVPGPGVQGRHHAGAGCHPRRRQSTARKESELGPTLPEGDEDNSDPQPEAI